MPPAKVLEYLNRHLSSLYTNENGSFVTAFYAVYNPADRSLNYARAGHNPPRLKRCQDGTLMALDQASGFALGIMPDVTFEESGQHLQPGDQIIFYTDGISETRNPEGKMFGTRRLDQALETCSLQASALLDSVLHCVDEFADGCSADDDRTIIVARV